MGNPWSKPGELDDESNQQGLSFERGGSAWSTESGNALPQQSLDENENDSEDNVLFVELVDLLEHHDEFNSNSNDEDSEAGDMDASSETYDEDEACDDEEDVAPLKGWELANAWEKLRYRELPNQSVAVRLIRGVTNWYAKQPSLIHVNRSEPGTQMVIVGDLHGHFGDMMHIIDEHGEPEEGPNGLQYLFNGDFVDRGKWGPEVLLTLYCLKLRFPSSVHLNRGNHEDDPQNREPANGFCGDHCPRAWFEQSQKMYKLCSRSFLQLPLCHIIDNEIAVIHGGLPLDVGITLDEIAAIDRKHHVPTERCCIHGYMRNQPVKTKRELRFHGGVIIPTGTCGGLTKRIGRTTRAGVHFQDRDEEFHVEIRGAPELEQDVEICFESDASRLKNRMDRLFTSLLWSDPINPDKNKVVGPNSVRGAGFCFDGKVVEDFLKCNGLRCLVRSHQKRPEGYVIEHKSPTGELLTATVFSASNYPAGVGEPVGNKACVLVLKPPKAAGQHSDLPWKAQSWRENYCEMNSWVRPWSPKHLHDFFAGDKLQDEITINPQSARSRVLEQMWRMIYCARPELLKYFHHLDQEETGIVSVQDWAGAMRACVIPCDDFPWEKLSPYLVDIDSAGCCHYGTFLARYKNILSFRLERHWCNQMLNQLSESLGEEEQVVAEWEKHDRNKTNRLSYSEFRAFFKAHIPSKNYMDEERIYTLLAALDKDHSGFVDRDEFIHAIVNESKVKPKGFCTGFEDYFAVQHCWAAVHGALRALCDARCRVTTMLQALDEDRDGLLNRKEFQAGLEKLVGNSAPSFEDWEPLLWQLLDEDNSGSVSPQELESALYVRDTKQVRARFRTSA